MTWRRLAFYIIFGWITLAMWCCWLAQEHLVENLPNYIP